MDARAEGDVRVVRPRPTSSASGSANTVRVAVGRAEQQRDLGAARDRRPRRPRCPPAPSARTSAAGCRSASAPRPPWAAGRGRRAARASSAGLRNSAHQPLPVTLTVASWPALSSSTQVPISSSSVSVALVAGERADQVVARVGAARSRARSAQVVGELRPPPATAVVLRLRRRVQLVHPADVGRPGPQQVPVRLGHAEHLRDDGHRQRLGDLGDQVAAALARRTRRPARPRSR